HPTPEISTLSLPDALPISAQEMHATVDTFCSRQLAQPRLIRPAAHDAVLDIRRQAAHCTNYGVDALARDQSRDAEQPIAARYRRSEEHTSELQSPDHLVCR